jgi:hypothetical protein
MAEDSRRLVAVESLNRLKSPKQSRRIFNVNTRLGDILGDDRAGSDDCAITDRDREYRSISPDTDMIAKFGGTPEIALWRRTSLNKEIINKHCAVRNEAVVPNRYELADKPMGLNPAPLADIYSLLYLYKWSYKGTFTNSTPIEIDWLHHRDVFTERYIDNPCMPNFWLCHKGVA